MESIMTPKSHQNVLRTKVLQEKFQDSGNLLTANHFKQETACALFGVLGLMLKKINRTSKVSAVS